MAKVDIEYESSLEIAVDVYCNSCGDLLDIAIADGAGTDCSITVDPCEKCLEAEKEGGAEGGL